VCNTSKGARGGTGVSSCMYNTPKYLLQEILDPLGIGELVTLSNYFTF